MVHPVAMPTVANIDEEGKHGKLSFYKYAADAKTTCSGDFGC
jgi:hypothetical protein